jgi:hypothetical protein
MISNNISFCLKCIGSFDCFIFKCIFKCINKPIKTEIHGISSCCIGDLAVPIGPIFCHPVVPTTEVAEPGFSTFGGMLVPVLQLISPVCKTGTSLFPVWLEGTSVGRVGFRRPGGTYLSNPTAISVRISKSDGILSSGAQHRGKISQALPNWKCRTDCGKVKSVTSFRVIELLRLAAMATA